MNRNARHRRGFTLIELLVVVSIIALLISILLPSLSRARQRARRTQCASRLRAVFLAATMYIREEGRFPDLNNEEEEGAWQYNYLIYDGGDFDNNFGPLARPDGLIKYVEQLYCPLQRDPYYSLATKVNPWPVKPNFDTRSSYGRRYGLSGKSLSQIREVSAFAADVLHLPSVVLTAHASGVNVVYTDGHAKWVDAPEILLDNELSKPFEEEDNPIVAEIWDELDRAGR